MTDYLTADAAATPDRRLRLVVDRTSLKAGWVAARLVESSLDRVLTPTLAPLSPFGAKRFQHQPETVLLFSMVWGMNGARTERQFSENGYPMRLAGVAQLVERRLPKP
jgi:hypothetical protein